MVTDSTEWGQTVDVSSILNSFFFSLDLQIQMYIQIIFTINTLLKKLSLLIKCSCCIQTQGPRVSNPNITPIALQRLASKKWWWGQFHDGLKSSSCDVLLIKSKTHGVSRTLTVTLRLMLEKNPAESINLSNFLDLKMMPL